MPPRRSRPYNSYLKAFKARQQKKIKEEVEMYKEYRRRVNVNASNQSTEKEQAPKLENIKRDKTPELDDIKRDQAPERADNERLNRYKSRI